MRYRIPVKLHKPAAKTKAGLDYHQKWEWAGTMPDKLVPRYLPAPGAFVVEITADTHAQAGRILQAKVRPYDKRPIMGRTNIKMFRVD